LNYDQKNFEKDLLIAAKSNTDIMKIEDKVITSNLTKKSFEYKKELGKGSYGLVHQVIYKKTG